MVQLSRPFQAIVAALALFVLVWFVVLHRPGSTSTGSGSSVGSSAGSSSAHSDGAQPTAQATAHHAAATAHHAAVSHAADGSHHTNTSHIASAPHAKGAAPHTSTHAGAVHHTSTGAGDHAHRTNAHTRATAMGGGRSVAHRHPAASHTHKRSAHTQTPAHPGTSVNATHTPALQATVAAELKHGRVALLLFWNPRSSDDKAVRQQLLAVAHKLGHRVAMHTAAANQVSAFGSITRDVQVFQTPTLLIVNPKGQVTTVTGYTDAYALEQTIHEARG